MTNGEFVSRVSVGLNAITKDAAISRRYILKIGRDKAMFYISQKLDDKSLYREANLFRTIKCFRLKEIGVGGCGIYEFSNCANSLMRSVSKLPGIIYSKFGPSIIRITTAGGIELKYTTPNMFSVQKSRRSYGIIKPNFYYVEDDYIYLPDSEVEYVNITYIPMEEFNVGDIATCETVEGDECKSMWDFEFIVPDKVSEQVITETINEVSNKIKIPMDENPNLDKNIISSTVK